MSRAGYSDDCDQWDLIKWRGQVAGAIRGKRGQAFLRELIDALEAMQERRLIAHELGSLSVARRAYEVCALGSVGVRRGMQIEAFDPEDTDRLADAFGIAHQLVREIEFMNDEAYFGDTPEGRWRFIRDWAESQLAKP